LDERDRHQWIAAHILPHEAEVRGSLRRYVHTLPSADADDVIQEAYARLWLTDFAKITHGRSYFYTIVRNLLLRFKEYKDLAALQRGPIVYCLEEQDLPPAMRNSFYAYLAEGSQFTTEHRPELLGGVTVLHGNLRLPSWTDDSETLIPVTFIPYGVWDNRSPGAMRIWLPGKKPSIDDVPPDPPGMESAT
jgi:hypothetical protein